jgi:ESCRT-I complex subunit VPS28
LLCGPSTPPLASSCRQICPILSDIISSLSRISSLPPDFGPKEKTKAWYSKLYAKPASYELNQDEMRQMLFDLESSYNEFISTIR